MTPDWKNKQKIAAQIMPSKFNFCKIDILVNSKGGGVTFGIF